MQWQMQSLIISTYSINYHYPHSFISSSHSTSPATTATATATACMQHACFHTCTLSIVWSEQKHHRASSCCPVSLKYWTNPNRRSKILVSQSVAERDVATYLLHVQQHIYYTSFWEQHICKSCSRCLSLLIPGINPLLQTFVWTFVWSSNGGSTI